MQQWPVLTSYDRNHLAKIALPLGGIGTGTISLGGRGDLRDFEIMNRPAKGFTPANAFFALQVESPDGVTHARSLEGPIDVALYEGSSGSVAANHGLPRFQNATFDAAYPFGQVNLSDPALPVRVRLQAFNPLIPTDADRSGIPVAILRYCIENTSDAPVTLSVCGSLPNFVGNDGKNALSKDNRNEWRADQTLQGILLRSEGVPVTADTWGTMALSTILPDDATLTYRLAWPHRSWNGGLLDFWDDFSEDGAFRPVENGVPNAALAVRRTLAAGATTEFTFLITWHFPNRQAWEGGGTIGNYYADQYANAWDVAVQTAAQLDTLERETLTFVNAFCDADLPAVVKEAALYNLSTLRTQTAFRLPSGHLMGWEGCGDREGCCFGSCTHVWNYEMTTAHLFGELACSMREVEFGFCTSSRGHMSFRAALPLTDGERRQHFAAADGQMGCLIKLYREWKHSGQDDFLQRFWPKAKLALAFCWIPHGWDADKDGVMEGCQHNTMDVEYYGPNPQMGAWYLGALRACEEMANYLGETAFAQECRRLFENGSAWMDAHLFNGEYYEHIILPPGDTRQIAEGLRHSDMGAQDLTSPELQLGAGCLIDQLVGQYLAHTCGLGYLLKPEHVARTLESLMRYNYQETLHHHFNHFRSFALAEEAAMLMATYPKGRRPQQPFPYNNEVMTGFEHQAAAHMLYEGQIAQGLRLLLAIRSRYDGRKRSPFDEAECGHHYARAMTTWGAVLALTGFQYDGVQGTIQFARPDSPVDWFWSTGYAWGTVSLLPGSDSCHGRLNILGGTLRLSSIAVAGVGEVYKLGDVQSLRIGSVEF